MSSQHSFSLPSTQRIKSRRVFELLFESGQSLKEFPFRLVWLTSPYHEKNPVKIAVSAPKRYMRKAHDRNRMKRLMREAYRLNKAPMVSLAIKKQKGYSLLFIAQVNTPLGFIETQEKIILLLQRLVSMQSRAGE